MQQILIKRRGLLPAFGAAVTTYDAPTGAHCDRVARSAVALGRALQLSTSDLAALSWGGALHDVGKLAVAEDILAKDGPLLPEEWQEIQRHPDVGADLLLAVSPELTPIAEIVRAHHERWDGTGYPHGTAGEETPLLGRLVAVVDAFDAMISTRQYHPRMTPTEALEELTRHAGSQFDPVMVESFTVLYRRGQVPLS